MFQRPRRNKRTITYCGILFLAGAAPAFAGDPTGDWRVADGVANIRVAECHGSMWGVVSWEKTPGGRDSNNPDASKQSRPTLGMPVLIDMKKKPNKDQWDGEVYNAKDGKSYQSSITLSSPDELEIKGCVLGFLCGGETWTRVGETIPSSPSNLVAETGSKSGAKTGTIKNSPKSGARVSSGKNASRTVGQKTGDSADPVGDICLLPDVVAGTAHQGRLK